MSDLFRQAAEASRRRAAARAARESNARRSAKINTAVKAGEAKLEAKRKARVTPKNPKGLIRGN